MKKVFYCMFITLVIIFLSRSVYSQWIPVNSGTNVDLLTMARSTDDFILCGGWDGVVLKSEDQGETWIENILTTEKIFHVDVFQNFCLAISDFGGMYKSIDSGNTWEFFNSFGFCTRGLAILSLDQIYVAGQYETVFELNTQGQSWFQIPNIVGANVWLRDITFYDNQNGFIVGDWGRAYKTPNFGYGWFLMNTKVSSHLSSVSFPSSDTGFICGLDGTIIKTIDGGLTWNTTYSGQTDFRNLYFLNNNEGYVSASDGIILHTSDGGESWELEEIATTEILKEFCYVPSISRLLVCGTNGTIFFKDLNAGLHDHNILPYKSCNFEVFPNPTKDLIMFRVSGIKSNTGNLTITSSDQKTIAFFDNISDGEYQVDFKKHPSGVYIYKYVLEGFVKKTGKIVLE